MISPIINDAFGAFWLFLPAGVANMAPPIANKIPGLNHWNAPMDFGRSYRGKRIFGDNKRWRGLVIGAILAGMVGGLEAAVQRGIGGNHIVIGALIGVIMGIGALLGDAVASFFKRQAGVKPGQSWFPFDQIDYIIGGLLLSYPFVRYTYQEIIIIFVVYFGLHLLVSYLGYLLRFKDAPI